MSSREFDAAECVAFGREVLAREGRAVLGLARSLGVAFGEVCDLVVRGPGRVLVSGVGKAGIIGRKISATLASTGTPSYWMDPLNAMHGDLGMVDGRDVALLLSNSGASDEILNVARALGGLGLRRIAMTSREDTALGGLCEHVIEIGELEEACPLRLAPSTSTTAMLALGDALALAVQRARGFTEKEYHLFHPSGALGRRLTPVREFMRSGEAIAIARPEDSLADSIRLRTESRCGACLVVDDDGRLLGIYTDGDFRRDMVSKTDTGASLAEHMTSDCLRVHRDCSVGEALDLMHRKRINALPVVDDDDKVLGLVDIQDIV